MTEQVRNTLLEEIREEERRSAIINELIVTVDRMWDNNESEESIKLKIEEVFKGLYVDYNSNQIKTLTNSFFIYITSNKNVRINLSDSQIASLRREPFSGEKDETCGTCLEEFTREEETIHLSCNHRFHPQCLIPWLKMSVYCPMCRKDLRE